MQETVLIASTETILPRPKLSHPDRNHPDRNHLTPTETTEGGGGWGGDMGFESFVFFGVFGRGVLKLQREHYFCPDRKFWVSVGGIVSVGVGWFRSG